MRVERRKADAWVQESPPLKIRPTCPDFLWFQIPETLQNGHLRATEEEECQLVERIVKRRSDKEQGGTRNWVRSHE